VAAGFEADLAVLDGDPSEDLGALARVRYTLCAGGIVHQDDESAGTPPR
jgi:imidazolonepropionase-like amidohydrolase